MGSRMERGLGHADHRDTELSVRVSAEAGPAAGVKVGVTVDHQEAQPVQTVQDRAHRRKFAQIELTRPVRQYLGHDFSAFSHHLAEAGIGGQDGCGPRTPRTQVVHIHGHERAPTRFHVLSLPDLRPRSRPAQVFRGTAMPASQSPAQRYRHFFAQTKGEVNPPRKPTADIGQDLLKDQQRKARQDYVLMRAATVIVVLAAAAIAVIFILIIAGYR